MYPLGKGQKSSIAGGGPLFDKARSELAGLLYVRCQALLNR
jgi:hypothetical protein